MILPEHDWSWACIFYRPIPGYPGYRVGNDGSFWSRRVNGYRGIGRWKRIEGTRHQDGYCRVTIQGPNLQGSRQCLVHVLVLEAFAGPCPPKMVCRHLNGDPSDNRLCNIRWGTSKENANDKIAHGRQPRGSQSPNAKLTESDVVVIRALHDHGYRFTEIARRYGVDPSRVSHILSGREWQHTHAADFEAVKSGRKFYARKVTEADIAEMFRLRAEGLTFRQIAKQVGGVDHSNVCRILNGKTWKHLNGRK